MPGLTIKQDKFCRAYVTTAEGNASEAYRIAYNAEKMKNATIHRRSKELMHNGKITARIEQLKAELYSQEAITVEEISSALRRAMDGAAAAGQWSAASQAAMGLAKLAGLLVEKRQVSLDDDHLTAVQELADADPIEKSENIYPLQKSVG